MKSRRIVAAGWPPRPHRPWLRTPRPKHVGTGSGAWSWHPSRRP